MLSVGALGEIRTPDPQIRSLEASDPDRSEIGAARFGTRSSERLLFEKTGGPGRTVAIKQFQSLAAANLANGSAWPAKAFPGAGKPPRQIAAALERGACFW